MRKVLNFSFVLMLLVGMSGMSFAQDWGRWNDRNDRYSQKEQREHQKLYNKGFKDGQKDRAHRRPYQIRFRGGDDRQDRQAYVAGYRAGFGSGYGYRR